MADDHSSHRANSTEIEMTKANGGKENVAAKTMYGQLSDRIAAKLALKSTSSSRHIFKVPEYLRKGNQSAYEPYMLAIGPYHRKRQDVQEMEEHKKEYLKELLNRRGKEALDRCVTAMEELEEEARSCYADDIKDTDTDDFVEMMLLDGCFIIELLSRFMDNTIIKKLGRDLLLVENQIPFIVLEKLFRLTNTSEDSEQPNGDCKLHKMILDFFADSVLPDQSKVMGELAICDKIYTEEKHQHLLSFMHYHWVREQIWWIRHRVEEEHRHLLTMQYYWVREQYWRIRHRVKENCRWFECVLKRRPPEHNEKFRRFMRCATELKEAGIKFKRVHRRSLIDIKFENGTMKIPQLEITGETESIFRNLIVYEQFSSSDLPVDKLVSHYIKFMDCLINSQKDVELFCKCNILHNCLGDDETVANMFNRLSDHFVTLSPDNYYHDKFVRVNKYCDLSRHTWIANLRDKYFNSPWAFISFFAAVLLLLFTLTQTVYSVLAYYK